MSNLMNKVKDALSSDHKSSSHTESSTAHHTTTSSSTTAPHENQRLGREGAGFTQPQGESFATTGGVEPNRGMAGPASSTDGPHKSNLMNKADPRVDSDADRSKNMGMNPHGTATTDNRRTEGTTMAGTGATHGMTTRSAGMTGENFGTTGTTGTTGAPMSQHRAGGVPEGTYGHHDSRLANAADPRIDSDLDSRRTAGTTGATTGGLGGMDTTTGTHRTGGLGGMDTTTGTHRTGGMGGMDTTTGTHRTGGMTGENLGAVGATTGAMGAAGHHGHHGTTGGFAEGTRTGGFTEGTRTGGMTEGTHTGYGTENLASTGATGTHHRTGMAGTGSGLPGQTENLSSTGNVQPGPAPNTAGPHKSDTLNKADPRVDSDLDGSKTYGGDKTYSQGASTTAQKDPRDATQVPPSVMQKHIGKPVVEHDDASHDRERRHSVNKTERHTGL